MAARLGTGHRLCGRCPVSAGATVAVVPERPTESLAEFAETLSYGSRSDLSFKYLSRLGPGVGDALASILREVGSLFDTGDPGALIDLATALQAQGYQSRPLTERYRYDDGPFTAAKRPVAESQVALLTSSGHFSAGDDPAPLGVEGMTQAQAEERIGEFLKEAPVLSEIPIDATADRIEVRHGGYDVRGSMADHNVSLPLDRLREIEADGGIGTFHDPAFSFVGACSQMRLIKETGPEWADRILATGSDVVLLVPV